MCCQSGGFLEEGPEDTPSTSPQGLILRSLLGRQRSNEVPACTWLSSGWSIKSWGIGSCSLDLQSNEGGRILTSFGIASAHVSPSSSHVSSIQDPTHVPPAACFQEPWVPISGLPSGLSVPVCELGFGLHSSRQMSFGGC